MTRQAPELAFALAARCGLSGHQLVKSKKLHEKSVTGKSAWVRLFDETFARLRFVLDGEQLTSAEVLDKLSHKDGAIREKAAKSFASVLKENISLFALLTNTLAKDKSIEDKWRGYERPISARNLANQVEDDVVQALSDAVTGSYSRLSHRYYALKAKWFGVDALNYWDRNAPLPEDDDTIIPWDDARKTVLDAYGTFACSCRYRPPLLRQCLDRCAGPGNVWCLRASDGAERAPLSAAELSRQDPGCDDVGS